MRTESRRSTQKAVSLKVHHAASTLGGEGQARSADSPVDTDGNRCRHDCCMYVLVVVDVLSAVLLRGDGRKARSKLAQKQLSGMDDCTDQQLCSTFRASPTPSRADTAEEEPAEVHCCRA